jgi:hypothetical protein
MRQALNKWIGKNNNDLTEWKEVCGKLANDNTDIQSVCLKFAELYESKKIPESELLASISNITGKSLDQIEEILKSNVANEKPDKDMETWQNAMKAIKVEYPYPMYNSYDQEKILKQRGFKYPKEFQKLDIESAKEDKQREAEESKEDESEVSNKPLTGEQIAEQVGITYNGLQDMGDGTTAFTFTDPQTGGTFLVIKPEEVKTRLMNMRKEFADAKKT